MRLITLIFYFVTLLISVNAGFASAFLDNEGTQEVKCGEFKSLNKFGYLLNLETFTINVVTIIVYQAAERHDVVKNVDFLLWTNKNPFSETTLKYDDSLPFSLDDSNFDENLPTKVIVHGFDGSGTQEWVINVKDAYLMTGKNV